MLVVALIAGYLYAESINKEGNTKMANITITLTEDELRALYCSLELLDSDRNGLMEDDDQWAETFESVDSFYRKVRVEKTVRDLAKENSHLSRTVIRKIVLDNLSNEEG